MKIAPKLTMRITNARAKTNAGSQRAGPHTHGEASSQIASWVFIPISTALSVIRITLSTSVFASFSPPRYRPAMPDDDNLTPASARDVEICLSLALTSGSSLARNQAQRSLQRLSPSGSWRSLSCPAS